MKTALLLSSALLAVAVPAQHLRHAVSQAEVVVVATDVAVKPVNGQIVVHRLQVDSTLKGEAPSVLSIVEVVRVATHERPHPGEKRLYCLRRLDAKRHQGKLPAAYEPYYKMTGHEGSNPLVLDPRTEPACVLARIVIESEDGLAARRTNTRLLRLAFDAPEGIRTEAVDAISEREALRDALGPLEISKVMSRAVGETEDIPFKIALATLCAEKKVEGLVEALCISLEAVEDPRFARAVGRIARRIHGEKAYDVLRPQLAKKTRKGTRDRLLLAMGATSTERALNALLRMRTDGGDNSAVDAALRTHGSRRALDAVATPATAKKRKKS